MVLPDEKKSVIKRLLKGKSKALFDAQFFITYSITDYSTYKAILKTKYTHNNTRIVRRFNIESLYICYTVIL